MHEGELFLTSRPRVCLVGTLRGRGGEMMISSMVSVDMRLGNRSYFHGATAFGNEGIEDGVEVLFVDGVELSFLSDLVKKRNVAGSEMGQELGLELGDLRGHHSIEVPSHTGEDDADLFFSNHGDLHY